MDGESRFAKHLGVNLRITQYSIYNEFYTTISCIIIMITFKTLRAPAVQLLQCLLWSAEGAVYTGSVRIAGKAFYRSIMSL